MTRSLSSIARAPLALVSLALLAGCVPYHHKDEWGSIVLFGRSGQCFLVAGPPRMHAVRGEKISWRVYNGCSAQTGGAQAKVTVGTIKLLGDPYPKTEPSPYFPDTPGTTRHKNEKTGQKKTDPLEPAVRTVLVPPYDVRDLVVTVKPAAELGLYGYVVLLNDTPDRDEEIDIWH